MRCSVVRPEVAKKKDIKTLYLQGITKPGTFVLIYTVAICFSRYREHTERVHPVKSQLFRKFIRLRRRLCFNPNYVGPVCGYNVGLLHQEEKTGTGTHVSRFSFNKITGLRYQLIFYRFDIRRGVDTPFYCNEDIQQGLSDLWIWLH